MLLAKQGTGEFGSLAHISVCSILSDTCWFSSCLCFCRPVVWWRTLPWWPTSPQTTRSGRSSASPSTSAWRTYSCLVERRWRAPGSIWYSLMVSPQGKKVNRPGRVNVGEPEELICRGKFVCKYLKIALSDLGVGVCFLSITSHEDSHMIICTCVRCPL